MTFSPDIDLSASTTISRIAFGSCHNNRKAISKTTTTKNQQRNGITIWDAIIDKKPDAFFWTGDAIYAPKKRPPMASPSLLRSEYHRTLHDDQLGYSRFVKMMNDESGMMRMIDGTWDDHDYGANDAGFDVPQKKERRLAFLEFLDGDDKKEDDWKKRRREVLNDREGVYHSIMLGGPPSQQQQKKKKKILVLFLDTRWNRSHHCPIPSIAQKPIPVGAGISCLTRWFSAGFSLSNSSQCRKTSTILGKEQWSWLQDQMNDLDDDDVEMVVVVSSVQVLSTNPTVESWGHFPEERDRLMRVLLRGKKGRGLVILSGDVHHAEILDTANSPSSIIGRSNDDDDDDGMMGLLEVTSSGLTHTCKGPFYGFLCEPILNIFDSNRFVGKDETEGPFYYIGKNFGSIEFDWHESESTNTSSSFTVNVHDEHGRVVLSTGPRPMSSSSSSSWSEVVSENIIAGVAEAVDGHLFLVAFKALVVVTVGGIITIALCLLLTVFGRKRRKRLLLVNDKKKF